MERVMFGKTDMKVSRIALGGYPFAGINRAQGWDPYTEEGKREVYRTIDAALDLGINYIDTAPSYGKGHSEELIGDVMKRRRGDCFLATKSAWEGGKEEVIKSVEDSLRRLKTDYVDVIQLHGGRFTVEDIHHIMEEGPLEALYELKSRGLARYLGITVEEPWTAIPFVQENVFDVYQVCYNLIRQSAGQHMLDETRKTGVAVCAMRPLTSGIFQRELEALAPEWLENGKAFEVCMKFILSDSRVHMANVGMRWSREVEQNMRFVHDFVPVSDIAEVPRLTQKIYETDDERKGGKKE